MVNMTLTKAVRMTMERAGLSWGRMPRNGEGGPLPLAGATAVIAQRLLNGVVVLMGLALFATLVDCVSYIRKLQSPPSIADLHRLCQIDTQNGHQEHGPGSLLSSTEGPNPRITTMRSSLSFGYPLHLLDLCSPGFGKSSIYLLHLIPLLPPGCRHIPTVMCDRDRTPPHPGQPST